MEAALRERVFHPENLERLRETGRKSFSGIVPWENEVRVRRTDGEYWWSLIRYNPLVDERGHLIRWCAAGTDIHDRKREEEKLREENLALRGEVSRSSHRKKSWGLRRRSAGSCHRLERSENDGSKCGVSVSTFDQMNRRKISRPFNVSCA